MLEDIIGTASNILKTPGLAMVGMGVLSAMVLRHVVSEANQSADTLICYQKDPDEFPLAVPLSIYTEDSQKSSAPTVDEIPQKTHKFNVDGLKNDVGKSFLRPCDPVVSQENESPRDTSHELASPNGKGHAMGETASKRPKSSESLCDSIQEIHSDPAAGDSVLNMETEGLPVPANQGFPSKSDSYPRSFTGPESDDSTMESVSWTEAFIEREPFDQTLQEPTTTEDYRGDAKNLNSGQ